MSQDKIAFENYMINKGYAVSYIGDGQYEFQSTQLNWEIWQAATAEANKRIAELTQDRNDLNYLCMERLHKIEELQASNNDLREYIKPMAIYDASIGLVIPKNRAAELLEATPAESLQAHDDELIEKCAKVADRFIKQEHSDGNSATALMLVQDYIRALKEVK